MIDKKDLEFYKEAEKTDKSIKVCEVNEEDFLYLNFDTNFSRFPPFLRSLRFIDNFKRMRMFLYTLNIYHA